MAERGCVSDPLPVASLHGLSPFVRGTLQNAMPPIYCPPYEGGQPAQREPDRAKHQLKERSDRQGVAHKPCCRNRDLLPPFVPPYVPFVSIFRASSKIDGLGV